MATSIAKDVVFGLGQTVRQVKGWIPRHSSSAGSQSSSKAGFVRFDLDYNNIPASSVPHHSQIIENASSRSVIVNDAAATGSNEASSYVPATMADQFYHQDNTNNDSSCVDPSKLYREGTVYRWNDGNNTKYPTPSIPLRDVYEDGYDGFKVDSTDDEIGSREDTITEWQAGWNVTNAIQGMFIVSFPYAVLHGGYWAIIAMTGIGYICCHTGKILVDCLYEQTETGEKVRIRQSYIEIAEAVWGRGWGGRIVNIAQIIELLMTCILYLVLCGDLLVGSFPAASLNLRGWILLSSIWLLPCALLTTLRHVSWLSFWNTVTHLIINAIVIAYCCSRSADWRPETVQFKVDIWTFPISLGIIVFSYTSQIFLPSLEGSLIDRSRFRCMLYLTHLAAAVFKALFGYLGYLTFGKATKEVITNNLPSDSLKVIVNLALVIKSLLSYPLPYYASVKLIETAFFQGRPHTMFSSCLNPGSTRLRWWAILLRILLILFTLVMALCIPHFAILMGLIGSFTGTMLSFVWPAYFHLKLKGHSLSWFSWLTDLVIIGIGIVCGAIGLYYSGHALHRVMRGQSVDPGNSQLPIFNKPSLEKSGNVSASLWSL